MKKTKENKGITLIAVVITIIVMLILVGVTLTVALNGGLFKKAEEAKTVHEVEKQKEQIILAYSEYVISKEKGEDIKLGNIDNAKIEDKKYGWDIKFNGSDKLYTLDFDGNIGLCNENGLPQEYQQVEYIESTGSQYININLESEFRDFEFYIECYETKYKNWAMPFNSKPCFVRCERRPNNIGAIMVTSGYNLCPFNSTMITNITLEAKGSTRKIFINDYYNEFSFGKNSGYSNTNLKLFDGGWIGRFYTSNIKVEDNYILNAIPCYRKSDGEIGIYDTVNRYFYSNNGTGNFLKGKDIN